MLGQLPDITDPNVLVGRANADDAGVYRISDDLAVVLTVDYFTPIVDEPYWYGSIAAANSLSDVWAMGARPVIALNLASFPDKKELFPAWREVLRGGAEKMTEAGVSVVGGHTIRDEEPKFGYAVMGLVHPGQIHDNSKARPGDVMVLTKPVGTGVVTTGIKEGLCGSDVIEEVTASMAQLNKSGADAMLAAGASTSTDITGFGLLGHMHEVLTASGLRAVVKAGDVPYFSEALRLVEMRKVPGGTMANRKSFSGIVRFEDRITEEQQILLNDAQTSGGLLIFMPSEKKDSLLSELKERGVLGAVIGEVEQAAGEEAGTIEVLA